MTSIDSMQLSERVWRICNFNLGRVSYPIQVDGADSSTASRGLFIAHALPTLIGYRVRVFTTHSLICRVPWIQLMIPKIHEHFTLQWLCQPVGPHYGGRAIIHLNFVFFDFSVDAEEPVIHVLRPFAGSPSVV